MHYGYKQVPQGGTLNHIERNTQWEVRHLARAKPRFKSTVRLLDIRLHQSRPNICTRGFRNTPVTLKLQVRQRVHKEVPPTSFPWHHWWWHLCQSLKEMNAQWQGRTRQRDAKLQVRLSNFHNQELLCQSKPLRLEHRGAESAEAWLGTIFF